MNPTPKKRSSIAPAINASSNTPKKRRLEASNLLTFGSEAEANAASARIGSVPRPVLRTRTPKERFAALGNALRVMGSAALEAGDIFLEMAEDEE